MRSPSSYLINRNYARLWYGQAVSTLGDFAFNTTVVLWVATVLGKGQPWAPAAVSGVLLSGGIAVLIVGPLSGVFVDRWSRLGTMLRSEIVRGLVAGLLAAISFVPTHDLPVGVWLVLIYVVVFALNSAGQFFGPSRFAIVGDIVSGDADRARAAGIGQATSSTCAIIGPPLAAPLLFTVGVQWALIFNAISYGVSFLAVRSVRLPAGADQPRPRAEHAKIRQEFAAGLRFFARSRFLVALLTIAVICQCGTGALSALNVFFVTSNLHAASHLYGFLGTALGIGGIVGGLISGRVVRWTGARATAWGGLFLAGALLILYARQTVFLSALVVLFLFALPVTTLNTAMTPMLLSSAPREYMGRVIAVFNPVVQVASMLSVVIAGWLASTGLRGLSASVAGIHVGRIDSIFTVSGLLVLAAGVYAVIALPHPAAEPGDAASPEAGPDAGKPEPKRQAAEPETGGEAAAAT